MYKSYGYCYVFKKEVIGHVFQINDNNRYMITLSLTVKKLEPC